MRITPRDYEGALLYCRQQHAHLSPPSEYGSTWQNDCQAFVHVAYGVGGGFGSAYAQWLGLDREDRHVTSDLSNAPLGALLFSKGSTPYGHVYIAARPFPNLTPAAWSTDLWRTGQVGKVARHAPAPVWGQRILGWGTSVNGYALDLTHGAVAKPMQNKVYQRIQTAINNLEAALPAAKVDADTHDIDAINAEISRLKTLYSNARHS